MSNTIEKANDSLYWPGSCFFVCQDACLMSVDEGLNVETFYISTFKPSKRVLLFDEALSSALIQITENRDWISVFWAPRMDPHQGLLMVEKLLNSLINIQAKQHTLLVFLTHRMRAILQGFDHNRPVLLPWQCLATEGRHTSGRHWAHMKSHQFPTVRNISSVQRLTCTVFG